MLIINFPCKETKTVAALSQKLKTISDDITVNFLKDTYYEELELEGLICKSLTLEGNGATFNGGKKLTVDFFLENKASNLYVSQLPVGLEFERLMLEEKLMILARYPNLDKDKKLGSVTSLDDLTKRAKLWSNPSSGDIRALHRHEWGGNSYKISGVVDDKIMMQWMGDNNRDGGFKKDSVLVENIKEECDDDKEWFYDKSNGRLYICSREDISGSRDITIADKISLIRISNCQTKISFKNFNFSFTERNTFKCPWHRYLRGDWAFNYGSAITFVNSENISLQNCNFDSIGGNCILIKDFASNIDIKDCQFQNCLSNGILVLGNQNASYCTSTWLNDRHITYMEEPSKQGAASDNYPRDISINNCLFNNLGLEDKQCAGVCISLAYRVSVTKSTFCHLPRAGINISENSFGGHLIADNDLFDCVRETCDHGPINAWGRDRFWSLKKFSTVGKYGKEKKPYALYDMIEPNIIKHNRVCGDRGFGIDLDDGCCNYVVTDNLTVGVGIKFREGFFRKAINNIIIDAPIDLHTTFAGNDDIITHNIVLSDNPINQIIVNKGFCTQICDNYFVTDNLNFTKQKVMRNQKNNFVDIKRKDLVDNNFECKDFEKFDGNFGRNDAPKPNLNLVKSSIVTNTIKNKYGSFSTIDDNLRSLTGSDSYDGLYVAKLSLFSGLKKKKVKKGDVIIKTDGKVLKNGEIDWARLQLTKQITVIRAQKMLVLKKT